MKSGISSNGDCKPVLSLPEMPEIRHLVSAACLRVVIRLHCSPASETEKADGSQENHVNILTPLRGHNADWSSVKWKISISLNLMTSS